MSVDVRVRPVRDTDLAVCVDIDSHARLDVGRQRGGEAWLADHPPLSEMINWSDASFVAEIDEVVVGFLIGRVDSTVRGRVFVVDRVYVLDEARELGCGDDLLAAATNHARANDCDLLEGVALPGDRETKNLYERAGVTARSITVSKRLSDPANSEDASR